MNVGKFTNQQLSEGINVLSLFDGMGCIWEVLESMGVKVANAYSSEIDKFANLANHHAHPYVEALGCVKKVNTKDLPKIDLIVGGSPCQGFSFAGKQLKFDDPRSVLFFEFVRILEECRKVNPDILFFLENVQMDKKSENVISRILGIAPIFIDSQLVCAQMRKRNYWTNIGIVQAGFFGHFVPGIPQPKDRGIFLKDILQPADEVDPKYHLSPTAMRRLGIRMEGTYSKPRILPEKSGLFEDKCPTVTANHFEQNHTVRQVLQLNDSKESGGKQPFQQNRLYDADGGLVPALCAQGPPPAIAIGRISGWRENENSISAFQNDAKKSTVQEQVYTKPTGKVNSLTTAAHANLFDPEHYVFRRLTPVECCRLQGVRDDFFLDRDGKQFVSDTQAYKMLGNGWQFTIKYLLEFSI